MSNRVVVHSYEDRDVLKMGKMVLKSGKVYIVAKSHFNGEEMLYNLTCLESGNYFCGPKTLDALSKMVEAQRFKYLGNIELAVTEKKPLEDE